MGGNKAADNVERFSRSIVRIGGSHGYLRDFYAALLGARWWVLVSFFAGAYLAVNSVFAAVYLLAGDAIAHARPGSFEDAFAFSVQTLSTVGYGAMTPRPPLGNIIVTAEVFAGVLLAAMATGMVFNKFARPSPGMIFASRAVVGPRNGQRCLMLRLANSRGGDIVDASIRLTATVPDTTTEGQSMRRLRDLKLERSTTPILLLSWLVIHPIDEDSPLWGLTAATMAKAQIRIFASVTGIDGTFMQIVYAFATYTSDDIAYDAHYVDVMTPGANGGMVIDLTKLDDVVPVGAPNVASR